MLGDAFREVVGFKEGEAGREIKFRLGLMIGWQWRVLPMVLFSMLFRIFFWVKYDV